MAGKQSAMALWLGLAKPHFFFLFSCGEISLGRDATSRSGKNISSDVPCEITISLTVGQALELQPGPLN